MNEIYSSITVFFLFTLLHGFYLHVNVLQNAEAFLFSGAGRLQDGVHHLGSPEFLDCHVKALICSAKLSSCDILEKLVDLCHFLVVGVIILDDKQKFIELNHP